MDNKGFSNGLLAGLITIILLLITYFINPTIMVKFGSYIGYVALIILMYKAGKEARDEAGGFISFGNVIGPIFLTFVIGSLIMTFFNYVLYNYIDVSLLDTVQAIAIEGIEKMEGFLGEEAVELAIEKMEEDGVQMGLGRTMLQWGIGLIIPGIIIALIEAAILKKEDKNAI